MSDPLSIEQLVKEHARAWRKVGECNPQLCYDPGLPYYLEEALELSNEIIKAFKAVQSLPASIQEALNSGDGSYRP